jgi:hypothetical protein
MTYNTAGKNNRNAILTEFEKYFDQQEKYDRRGNILKKE